MHNSNKQLVLPVGIKDSWRLENYVEGENLGLIKSLSLLNAEDFCYFISGREGQGKSHLLNGVCHRYFDNSAKAMYLSLKDNASLNPEVLQDLDDFDVVCLDDLDSILGNGPWEEAVFHLFNQLRDAGKNLVVAASAPVRELEFDLADLNSRLRSSLVFQLKDLSDEAKVDVLIAAANARGMRLEKDAANFLMVRSSRNFHDLFTHLDRLDQASLETKRLLTIPFLKQLYQW